MRDEPSEHLSDHIYEDYHQYLTSNNVSMSHRRHPQDHDLNPPPNSTELTV